MRIHSMFDFDLRILQLFIYIMPERVNCWNVGVADYTVARFFKHCITFSIFLLFAYMTGVNGILKLTPFTFQMAK